MENKDWYFKVNDYCVTLAEMFDLPLIKVAGILSALSPNTSFKNNVMSLERFIKTNGNCKVTTYNAQKNKALEILRMENPTVEGVKKILGGIKTQSFFDNIYRPKTSEEVTIDIWMMRWAKIDGSLTPKRYRDVSLKIKNLAKELNLLPHQVQAKIWVDIRGEAW